MSGQGGGDPGDLGRVLAAVRALSAVVEAREASGPALSERELEALVRLPAQVQDLTSIATIAAADSKQVKELLLGNGKLGLVAQVDALEKTDRADKERRTRDGLAGKVAILADAAERQKWFVRLVAGGTVGAIIALIAQAVGG